MKEFLEKVHQLNPDALPITEYNKKYLVRLLQELPYRAFIYQNILNKVVELTQKPLEKLNILDFGGGTGLLSCFAKWSGANQVQYLDIFEPSVKDAEIIASRLDLKADAYIYGGLDKVNSTPHVIISMDVIEHVYNLEEFFEESFALNPDMIHIHVTGANPYHPIIKRRLKKIHYQNEWLERPKPAGAKPSDNYHSFHKMRKDFLQQNTSWENDLVEEVAILTRGMNYTDITKAIKIYEIQRIKPLPLPHPTNTCDPKTGNWSERLMTQKELNQILQPMGKHSCLDSIGYNVYRKNRLTSLVFKVINFMFSRVCSKNILPLLLISVKQNK